VIDQDIKGKRSRSIGSGIEQAAGVFHIVGEGHEEHQAAQLAASEDIAASLRDLPLW
jgi:hypothetical protein